MLLGTVEGPTLSSLQAGIRKAGQDFGIYMNAKFLRKSMAIHVYQNPSFITIGKLDARSNEIDISI
jgi:UDP-glucose 6-dehydrogenase